MKRIRVNARIKRPNRETAFWMYDSDDPNFCDCSACGGGIDAMCKDDYNYCPFCGAVMLQKMSENARRSFSRIFKISEEEMDI